MAILKSLNHSSDFSITDSGQALAILYALAGALTTLGPYLNSADTAALIISSLTTYATSSQLTALGLDVLYSVSQNYQPLAATLTVSHSSGSYIKLQPAATSATIRWDTGNFILQDLSSGAAQYGFKITGGSGNCRSRGSMTATSFPTSSDKKK